MPKIYQQLKLVFLVAFKQSIFESCFLSESYLKSHLVIKLHCEKSKVQVHTCQLIILNSKTEELKIKPYIA